MGNAFGKEENLTKCATGSAMFQIRREKDEGAMFLSKCNFIPSRTRLGGKTSLNIS